MNLNFNEQRVGNVSYLVQTLDNDDEIDMYSVNMMDQNDIPNLIHAQLTDNNGFSRLEYDVTNMESLINRLGRSISKADALSIFYAILGAFDSIEAYMLEEGRLILNSQYAFVDNTGNCRLMYIPIEGTVLNDDKIGFLRNVATAIIPDYSEKDSAYIFKIANAFSSGSINSLSEFKELLRKLDSVQNTDSFGQSQVSPVQNALPAVEANEPQEQSSQIAIPGLDKKIAIPSFSNKESKSSAKQARIPVVNIPGKPVDMLADGKPVENKAVPVQQSVMGMAIPGREKAVEIPGKKPEVEKPSHKGKKNNPEVRSKGGLGSLFGKKNSEVEYDVPVVEKESVVIPPENKREAYVSYERTILDIDLQKELQMQNVDNRAVGVGESPLGFPGMTPKAASAYIIRKCDGSRYPLKESDNVLGRGLNSDIMLNGNPYISRFHAVITWQNGRYYIKDIEYRNGCFINGIRLEPERYYELADGMTFSLVEDEFIFHIN